MVPLVETEEQRDQGICVHQIGPLVLSLFICVVVSLCVSSRYMPCSPSARSKTSWDDEETDQLIAVADPCSRSRDEVEPVCGLAIWIWEPVL
jgi:hypothetical protein